MIDVTVLDVADLAAAVAAAQAALLAAPPGASHEWRLPAPADGAPVTLGGPLVVGDPVRSLSVVAAAGSPARPVLQIAAGAAAAGLHVVGADVLLRGIDVEVEGQDVTGVLVTGTGRARVVECAVRVRGRAVTGLDVRADGLVEVVGVAVPETRSTVGVATGLDVAAPTVRVHRVDVHEVSARTAAQGVRAAATAGAGRPASLTLSRVRVQGVAGADAVGVQATAGGLPAADPESAGATADSVTLLDVAATTVHGRAVDALARGVVATSAGLLDARGLSVTDVSGATAVGCDVLVGGALVLSGAGVHQVVGGAGGSAGVAVHASASRADLSVDDAHVEEVHAVGHADAVRGLAVSAPVSELAPWVDDDTDPGELRVTGCALRRISGTALDVDADLRDVEVRGVEVYSAARAATLRGERITVTESTWHRLQRGLSLGPGTLTLVDSLITEVATGPALDVGPEGVVASAAAAFARPADPAPLLAALPDGLLPYVEPGPAGVPASLAEGRFVPEVVVDLRLAPAAGLHASAVRTPADPPERPVHVGARPPVATAECDLRDPLTEPPDPVPEHMRPGPVLDRLARDGRGLLRVMQARAAVALPGWVPGDAADLTTTLVERLTHELDRVSYAQDAALAEAAMPSARLRRSIEEHARLVDYAPDPGLSATTMLRVEVLDPVALGLTATDRPGARPFTIGRDTVAVNPDAGEDPVVMSTEEDLEWQPSLAELSLVRDVAPGENHALLAGDLLDLQRDRWLVLEPEIGPGDRSVTPHVVRATLVELGTDETLVWWDPRRPAPRRFVAGRTRVLGNVVPAHHGLRLAPTWSPAVADPDLEAQVASVTPLLDVVAEAPAAEALEVPLPLAAVSRVAPGWPFPGEPPRAGEAEVLVAVDGEPWRLVADVATDPGEVFAVAAQPGGGSLVVLGQPGALPARPVHVTVEARLGIGSVGNIGAHSVTSLVALGPASTPLPDGLGLDGLRRALLVDNPVPGTGGRDPEPLDRIRRRAPWVARTPVAAVTPADYARLLEELPEVAAARARILELGERRVVHTTLLLRDEDTLVPGGPDPDDVDLLDPVRDAERLRRWSLARRRLEEIRLLGFDVELVPPTFVPVDLDVVVDAQPWASAEQVHRDVTAALAADGGLFDPDTIGLGGDVHVDAILRRALALDSVHSARVARLRRLRPGADEHAVDGVLPIEDEEVAVLRRPYGDGPDGLLTVEVCGGVR